MNNVFLRLKRAHHADLRLSRDLLGDAITPARFDMLRAIHIHGDRFGILQGELRGLLGVTSPVVSRMLDALEDLGHVWRELDEDDGRRRVITLTPQGRALVLRLLHDIVGADYDTLAVDCALGGDLWHDEDHCAHERETLLRALRAISSAFRDRATLDYDRPPPS